MLDVIFTLIIFSLMVLNELFAKIKFAERALYISVVHIVQCIYAFYAMYIYFPLQIFNSCEEKIHEKLNSKSFL